MAIRPTIPALKGADPQVLRDIQRAAAATSVDFGYLVAQASQESSFRPDAKAATSTATGLYQFTESTWLREFRLHGAQYGYGDLAQAVTADDSGRERVANPDTRKQILDLRKDPALSAALAAELAKENRSELEQTLGRAVNHTELYLAHFLGAGGASKLISAVGAAGATKAADLLPAAAAANPSVFYDENGTARTVSDLYGHFAARIEGSSSQTYAAASSSGSSRSQIVLAALSGGGASTPFGPSLGLFGEPTERNPLGQQALNSLTVAALSILGNDPPVHRDHGANGSSDDKADNTGATSHKNDVTSA